MNLWEGMWPSIESPTFIYRRLLCRTIIRHTTYQGDTEKSCSGTYYKQVSKQTEIINTSPQSLEFADFIHSIILDNFTN